MVHSNFDEREIIDSVLNKWEREPYSATENEIRREIEGLKIGFECSKEGFTWDESTIPFNPKYFVNEK